MARYTYRRMNKFKYFLIEYNHDTREVLWTEFAVEAEAFALLGIRERGKSPREEVVLFMAESIEMLKRTHSRYFGPPPLIFNEGLQSYRAS